MSGRTNFGLSEIPFIKRDLKNNKTTVVGDSKYVRDALEKWLLKYDQIQLISDVCHYDMVLFIDIFGTAFDLPKNINTSCHDINQDIAAAYSISEAEAFDKSREEILSSIDVKIWGDKHNALYDAKVIRQIYYARMSKLNNSK